MEQPPIPKPQEGQLQIKDLFLDIHLKAILLVQVVTELFRHGMLQGYKPGGWRVRKDGRASNAVLRLSAGSVLHYKQRQEQAAGWQAAQ